MISGANLVTSSRTVDSPQSEQARWFAAEVQPYEPVLRSYLRGDFPGVRDIDDVVQESYLRIWKARAAQPVRSAKSFLFTVARHLALDLMRRSLRSPIVAVADLSALDIADDQPDVRDAAVTQEKLVLLAQAVATLPPRCREVVVLCKIRGLTHREAATRLGLSEKTVDEQILRGLKRLGVTLRAQGHDRHFSS